MDLKNQMIKCADLRCKYYKNGKCICKRVELTYWNINTLFEGRKDLLECKSFKYDKEYLKLKKELEEVLKGADKECTKENMQSFTNI